MITLSFLTTVSARWVKFACLLSAFILMVVMGANAQTRRAAASSVPATNPDEDAGVYKEYRGIQLGMTADEVRKKLGTPRDKSDEQDFYMFGENETAQIVYDRTSHKVTTISADFLNIGDTVPTAKTVFGGDVEAKPDGSIYKMVRFTKAGYWVSFNRTSGNAPLTTVTLQKIQ
jgi:hypothetical protein